jgi:hypothetical protein
MRATGPGSNRKKKANRDREVQTGRKSIDELRKLLQVVRSEARISRPKNISCRHFDAVDIMSSGGAAAPVHQHAVSNSKALYLQVRLGGGPVVQLDEVAHVPVFWKGMFGGGGDSICAEGFLYCDMRTAQ